MKFLSTVAVVLAFFAGTSHAATFNPSNDSAVGGNNQLVYQLSNGNYLGLVGIENTFAGDAISLADVNANITSGVALAAYFGDPSVAPGVSGGQNTPNPAFFGEWTGAPAEFTPFVDGTTIAATSNGGTKFFDALWLEYSSTLVFAGTNTLGTQVTLQGDPLSAVPVPAALPLLLAGLGGFAVLRRRKNKAA